MCYFASVVSNSLQPKDCNPPAPLSLGFSRQEYWIDLQFPSPGIFPTRDLILMSPVLAGMFFTLK